MFKIYHPTPAIHLVIRIEKLYCGNDLDKEIGYYLKAKYVQAYALMLSFADGEPYSFHSQAKAKDASKLREEVESFVKQNKSTFKKKPFPFQPFAWVQLL